MRQSTKLPGRSRKQAISYRSGNLRPLQYRPVKLAAGNEDGYRRTKFADRREEQLASYKLSGPWPSFNRAFGLNAVGNICWERARAVASEE